MNFQELANQRRSVVKFELGVEITNEELGKIFELTKLAPSCFNLQHAQYLVIRDQVNKDKAQKLAFNQYKVGTASAVILVLGDKKAYKNVEQIYSGMKLLRMIDEYEYEEIVKSTYQMYEGNGERFQEEEAIRNASLSAMTFMFAAEHYGWNTCPMIGFDPNAMKEAFNIPENLIPMLMITLGKADKSRERKRGYRKPNSEFVTYEEFKK